MISHLFSAIRMIIIIGGIFALIHGVKRVVDNILSAWVKSAIPKAFMRKT